MTQFRPQFNNRINHGNAKAKSPGVTHTTKGVKAMKNLTYSAISYVAAALLLSGQALANPADLSGALSNNVPNGDQGVYLALNRYPVALPALSTTATNKASASTSVAGQNNEAYIDSLQRELKDQLDILIESQAFAAD